MNFTAEHKEGSVTFRVGFGHELRLKKDAKVIFNNGIDKEDYYVFFDGENLRVGRKNECAVRFYRGGGKVY